MHPYYLSQPVIGIPVNAIDESLGIIKGITVARIGPARGHDGQLDKTFLLQVVDMASARPQGVKARFGHPNICATSLGTYLGRFHNYAYHGDRVTADLHLDPTAKNTPNGNIFDYVINMAKHNPDMFGASLVFESDGFAQSEDPAEPSKSPVRFFRLKELRATDIVDDPAATDGLFSALSVSAQATDLLDQNPALVNIIFSNPNAIIEFLNNYLINNTSTMNFSDSIKENFRRLFNLSSSDNPPATDPPAAGSSDDSPADPPPPPADDHAALIQRAFSQFHALMPLPDISTDDQGRFFFQSPDSPQMLSPEDQIATMFQAIEALHAGLQAARSSIADLTDRLAARPTIPSNVTDPQVSSSLSEGETDDTGKQILKNLPPDLLYKFRLSAPHAKPQKP